jgi:hypothetical protein
MVYIPKTCEEVNPRESQDYLRSENCSWVLAGGKRLELGS